MKKNNSSNGRRANDRANSGPASVAYSPFAYLKRPHFKRSRLCPLAQYSKADINYKNVELIQRYTSEYGRILPSRITSVSPSKQRALSEAVKHARFLAIVPYCHN